MISNKMYKVLSTFPQNFKPIQYEDLLLRCKLPEEEIMECLNETLFPSWNFVRTSNGFRKGSELWLTESGRAEVDAYIQERKNTNLVKWSLAIAIVAMLASAISALASIVPALH